MSWKKNTFLKESAFKKSKFRDSKYAKMVDFGTLDLPNLISRKIWVTEKLCNFHTVSTLNKYLSVKFISGANLKTNIVADTFVAKKLLVRSTPSYWDLGTFGASSQSSSLSLDASSVASPCQLSKNGLISPPHPGWGYFPDPPTCAILRRLLLVKTA